MKFLRGTSYRDKYLACEAECDELKRQLETMRAERDAHKLQAETALAQLEEVATSLTVCMQERDKLQAQPEAAPKKRTSRAKPPAPQE